MIRTLFTGVAALALMTGVALADESYSQSTVVAPAPAGDSVSKTTTQKSVDSYGNQTERTDSVQKSQAMTPDGDTSTVTRTKSTSGIAPAPMGSSSTTTIRTDE